jgi:cation transport ATPase
MANETQELDKTTAAFALSAAITVLFSTLMTWIKELSEPFHDFLAVLTGHHWTTQGVVVLIVFVVLGWIFMRTGIASRMSPTGLINTLVAAVIIAGIGIAGFFLIA